MRSPISETAVNPTLSRRQFLLALGALAGAVAGLPLLERVRALASAGTPLRIVIVGGGLAGLCAAYELEKLGHSCVILEAEDKHIGGRARTLRFPGGLYGEAGAMRIPLLHDLTRRYVKEFGLSLRPFVGSSPRAFYVSRNVKVRTADVLDLSRHFALVGDERGKTPQELDNEAMGPILDSLSEAERRDFYSVAPRTEKVHSLSGLQVDQALQQAGLSAEAIEYVQITQGGEQFIHVALTEILRESVSDIWSLGLDEIVGGTDTLPRAFAEHLLTPPRMGCEVIRLEQDFSSATAVYRRKGQIEREEGDFVLCTLPFSVLERIDTPSFSPAKRRAIRQLFYQSSVKTLAVSRERFWEQDGIFGGSTATDLFSGSTYYPSDNAEARDPAVSNGPGVMLASYTWGEQARRQAGLSNPQRVQAVLSAVGSFHPELTEPGMVQQTATWSWDRHPWSLGGFSFFLPGQWEELYADIIRPEGRIHIAGEHASLSHSWMQGAFESALRAVAEIIDTA